MRAKLVLVVACLAGCAATQPTVQTPVYVPRVVNECSWAPKLTFAKNDTAETKREVIAYETARQKNCPGR